MSGEHGIDANGKYIGSDDLELQRINVYFNEGQEGRCVTCYCFEKKNDCVLEFTKASGLLWHLLPSVNAFCFLVRCCV